MNTSSDPTLAGIQGLLLIGSVLWWLYGCGALLSAFAIWRTRGWLRETAWWSLRAQIAPALLLVLLLMVSVLQLTLNRGLLAHEAVMALLWISLAAGPAMSVWLICALLLSKVRGRRNA